MSGSVFRATVAAGDERVFFARDVMRLGVAPNGIEELGRLGVSSESIGGVGVEDCSEVGVEGCVVSFETFEEWALSGDLNGFLNGERNGLESVLDAASIRRRLAAGVDILT
jgi:hypothetical protein